MRKPIANIRKKSGQALIEYALVVMLVLGVFFTIDVQIRKTIGKVWKSIAKNVAPACVGCELPEALK